MPGPEIKNWPLYEKLRTEGHSKESAARIANASVKKRKKPPPPKARK